ncbi:armadillo repeat-containing protein 7 [Maniola hyperantus]|uniref:armadillo repeat-containing protein 7 n=1 Tax=Aphantopus hyperantus TaxID=2795564 RepID=UPI001568CF21|nr:armadillo repeat-containing protein 7 [Maniola hyperantus]
MFSSKVQLQKRTPENGTDRESYLTLLVDEYINKESNESKCQVLANLANFAYDPINYGFIRDVGGLDIFIHVLKNENNGTLLHFAASGISNLCIDPENVEYVLKHADLKIIRTLLKSSHSETVAEAITIFIYLYHSHAKSAVESLNIIPDIQSLTNSEIKVISNLANIFIDDVNKGNCANN